MEEIVALEKKVKNYTSVKVDAVCLNPSANDDINVIEDLDLAEEDIIIAELPKSKDTWTFVPLNV